MSRSGFRFVWIATYVRAQDYESVYQTDIDMDVNEHAVIIGKSKEPFHYYYYSRNSFGVLDHLTFAKERIYIWLREKKVSRKSNLMGLKNKL